MKNILYSNLSPDVVKNLFGCAERNMLWSCQADPRFMYYGYSPMEEDIQGHKCPILVYIHGTGGSYPTPERKRLEKFAAENKCMILAPLFPGGLADVEDFNSYKLISCYGIHFDLVLLAMLDELKQRYPAADTSNVIMFGHSGGAQFVHRFFYLHPDRLKGVSISAPGRVTRLDNEVEFFEGTKNWKEIFDREIDYEALKKVPVQFMCGELDTSYIGDSPAGTTRLQRINSLNDNFRAHGIKTELCVIPGIAHEDGGDKRIDVFCSWVKQFL